MTVEETIDFHEDKLTGSLLALSHAPAALGIFDYAGLLRNLRTAALAEFADHYTHVFSVHAPGYFPEAAAFRLQLESVLILLLFHHYFPTRWSGPAAANRITKLFESLQH